MVCAVFAGIGRWRNCGSLGNERMEPDKRFIKELKEVDGGLSAGWNFIKHRWQIIRDDRRVNCMGFVDGKPLLHTYDKPYFVFTVENEDKSYRPLDQRVIDRLHEIDLYRYARLSDFVKEVEKEEDDFKAKQSKRQSEYVEELTKDNFRKISDAIEADSYGGYGRNR